MKILITHKPNDTQRDSIRQVVPEAELTFTREPTEIAMAMADASVVWGSRFDSTDLPSAKNLAFIQVSSAGVNHVLTPELIAHPAQLCNAKGIHGATIAEHVFLMMLAAARQLSKLQDAQAAHEWVSVTPELLAGKTLGIVGYGSIGQAIAKRAKAFEMHVIGLKRRPADDPYADQIWPDKDLHRLLPIADYLVLAVPLTAETRKMIGPKELIALKNTAVLINIARGEVIDEPALIEFLRQNQSVFAGLDVFEREPLPKESKLWSLPNVLVTPHMAGSMPDYDERAFTIFLENLRRWQEGKPLLNVVDKQLGY